MKKINGGEQMRDVWTMPAIARWEKTFGKHPTQKPLPLLCRILMAATQEYEWVLDPFTGSSTTGIACSLLNRRFLGIDQEKDFLDLSIKRYDECQQPAVATDFRRRIPDLRYWTRWLKLARNRQSMEIACSKGIPQNRCSVGALPDV